MEAPCEVWLGGVGARCARIALSRTVAPPTRHIADRFGKLEERGNDRVRDASDF